MYICIYIFIIYGTVYLHTNLPKNQPSKNTVSYMDPMAPMGYGLLESNPFRV